MCKLNWVWFQREWNLISEEKLGRSSHPEVFLGKKCSENMQQINRRTSMPMCDFSKVEVALRHGCSPVNLLHIFRTPFPKNTSERLLLKIDHLNSWLSFSFKCLTHSDFLSVPFSGSFHLVIKRYAQFVLYNLSRRNICLYILHNCNDLLCLYYWINT